MCSVCGLCDFKKCDNLNTNILNRMGASLKHRGVDNTDIFVSKNVLFHHNRLSVIDPEGGNQPMSITYGADTYTICYNGELYNTDELRCVLKKHGVSFKTNCDTEVLLYTYIIFGDECVNMLNGIFAFAVYDESKQRVFFARDRFGIKPFFYSLKDSLFLFASEIKALLIHPSTSSDVDRIGLWQLMFLSPVKINGSGIFKDILELKPACCGHFDKDGLSIREYWSLKAYEFTDSRDEAVEKVRWLMTDAIKRQLVSDVPLATFLSGGLDSSVITAVASAEYRQQGRALDTYSFEYEDNKRYFKNSLFQPQGDDEYALYLADYLGCNHTVLTAPTYTVASNLVLATDARDMPGQADIDSSLLYFCKEVKKRHTVVLSGECSDEIFGGYPWFYREEMLSNGFFPWIHNPTARCDLFDSDIIRKKEAIEFMREFYLNDVKQCPTLDGDNDAMKTSRIATWLSYRYFMTSLLERKDRMSMASSLEVRVPFADHRIIEYVFNVPWEIKFENGVEKALLRNAIAEYLPDKILNRKKSPYPKTHNPRYEQLVTKMLGDIIKQNGPVVSLLNFKELDKMLKSDNVTWFGQLMGKPQLIAWIIQFNRWLERYNVNIV